MNEGSRISQARTPYAVRCISCRCNDGELIYITGEEYIRQMNAPDAVWQCPICEGRASWSDHNYEDWYDDIESEDASETEAPC